MLGDGGLRQWQFVHDVAAHPRLFPGEHPQDPHTRRMGYRPGEGGQLVVGCRSVNQRGEQLNGLLLRWAADRLVGLARRGVRNGFDSHRQSSIDDSTGRLQPTNAVPEKMGLTLLGSVPIVATANDMDTTSSLPAASPAELQRDAQALQAAVADLVRVYLQPNFSAMRRRSRRPSPISCASISFATATGSAVTTSR
jgi:hypothetical protein